MPILTPGSVINVPNAFTDNVGRQVYGFADIGIGGTPNGRISISVPSPVTPQDSSAGKTRKESELAIVVGLITAMPPTIILAIV